MQSVLVTILLLLGVVQAQQRPRVLLGVFAHPDDETIVGPILARYAREGVKVYAVFANDGQKGVRPHAGIAAGEELGKVRREEARCSCRQLGIEEPIFFGLQDSDLITRTAHTRDYLMPLMAQVRQVIGTLKPDAVITWGSDGGYGNSDHIAVSLAVTQVIQEGGGPEKLFFVGFPKQLLPAPYDSFLVYRPTDERYLTVRIPFEERDLLANDRAVECHRSQFSSEEMQQDHDYTRKLFGGYVWFRPWFGSVKSKDLFRRAP